MALYDRQLKLESLLPIQGAGVSAHTLLRLAGLDSTEPLPPIEAVLYDADAETYLIADGHNRSYLAHMRGEDTIDAKVAVDSDGVMELSSIALSCLRTMEEVRDCYENSWLRYVQEAGITSVATMPVCNDLPNEYM